METRNISLTLEKAKEWYSSDNEALREAALQAYTKEELTEVNFRDIVTFIDACEALDLDLGRVREELSSLDMLENGKHLVAIYKLDIICKALNRGWNPSLVKDEVYYPYVMFYPAGKKAREATKTNGWAVKETFDADGERYSLIGGAYGEYCDEGLGNFIYGSGVAFTYLGLLGCRSAEAAKHMSRYFAKEIFEACYAQHAGTYKWI